MTDQATQAQIHAANPKSSTWLSANAGSGKTRVLTDRVALLLLNGVLPQRILCLTYTKAAASEMQNRLFKRLGFWAMMPDDELQRSLVTLGVSPGTINSDLLRDARRLFAKAIETPGGLKIQTIHSFCASLLRRFPLEAGVSPAFTEMDDRGAIQLRAEVLDRVAEDNPQAMQGLAAHFTGEDPDGLLREIASKAHAFHADPSDDDLRKSFRLSKSTTQRSIVDSVVVGGEQALCDAMIPHLQQGGSTDENLANALIDLDFTAPDIGLLARLEQLCLITKEPFMPKERPPTNPIAKAMGPLADEYRDLRQRVADARPDRLAFAACEKTKALHAFAKPFLTALDTRKQQKGWLDFDDLILKARALLTDPGVAAWVLFRLDGGIDHILVDEAQDTSPTQWEVIKLLAQEFTAGTGARAETERTIFVVGDQKQSIYSFQGADPAAFDDMRDHFDDALKQIDAPFSQRELLYSFRSAKPILDLVDATFTGDLSAGMGNNVTHLPFKENLPGRVDLWHWIEGEKDDYDEEWFDPIDTVGSNHHSVQLAREIARTIDHQIKFGRIKQVDGHDDLPPRRIRPRDFLILVQSRSSQGGLFHEIIRACKDLRLPMAGADRLRVGAELGVRDLTSLLSYLATPQDDLSLAEILRSPLGGISEADLFDLAHDRGDKYLWQSLEDRQTDFLELTAMLDDLKSQADFLRPYELLERALTRHHCRDKLLSRLGPEAEEGITALLDQAITYERTEIPSLTGFLTWLAADDLTIKRQLDTEGDQIRVMTVHGAKGLEAPIVILPNTGKPRIVIKDDIMTPDDTAQWKAKSAEMPKVQADLAAQMKQRQFEESMRLLYVAMTRAESWLIICGSGEALKGKGETWYEIAEAGLIKSGAKPEGDTKLRLSHLGWPADLPDVADSAKKDRAPLPDWTQTKPPTPRDAADPLSPSNLGGAKVLPGPPDALTEAQAMARGTAIHTLLEHLADTPKADRAATASNLLAQYDNPVDEDLLALATNVLDAPSLQFLFETDAFNEVPLTAEITELGGQRILGTIDRLLTTPEKITAIDFKSNRLVPTKPEQTPLGLLRQMGAYAAALTQIYPDHEIETGIVWTETAQYMALPHDIVMNSLSAPIHLDDSEPST